MRALRGLVIELVAGAPAGGAARRVERRRVRDDAADVLGRRAAAAADDVDAELGDELGERGGQRVRLHRVDGLAADVERQAGVGDRRDGQRDVLGEPAHRLAHVLRAGRAVEADHVHAAGSRGWSRAAAMSVPSSMRPLVSSVTCAWMGTHAPGLGAGAADAGDGGAHFEDVLAGLDQQQIDAALDQRDGLLAVQLGKLLVGDVAERGVVGGGQHAGRPHRAGDEARPLRRC